MMDSISAAEIASITALETIQNSQSLEKLVNRVADLERRVAQLEGTKSPSIQEAAERGFRSR